MKVNMRRALWFAFSLLTFDQLLKFSFQLFFHSDIYMFSENYGFRYIINPGILINPKISLTTVALFQIIQITSLLLVYNLMKFIKTKFNSGILLDISFGFFATGLLGNLVMDRFLIGGIRDYFVTPIGIANFADIGSLIGLLLLITELTVIFISAYFVKSKNKSYN